MRKGMSFVWVKNVNNRRITGGIGSVLLSPINILSVQSPSDTYGKQRLIQYIIHIYTALFPTYICTQFNLLLGVYPHNPQGLLLEPTKRI